MLHVLWSNSDSTLSLFQHRCPVWPVLWCSIAVAAVQVASLTAAGVLSFLASHVVPPGHHGDGGVQTHGLFEAGAQEGELAQVGILQSSGLGALRCHQQSRCVQLSLQLVLRAHTSPGHSAQLQPCRAQPPAGLQAPHVGTLHSASRSCCPLLQEPAAKKHQSWLWCQRQCPCLTHS